MHGNSTPSDPFAETQTFAGFLNSPDLVYLCETWYQVDTYKPGHPFGTTVFTLSSPAEDAQWIKSWRFLYGGDCGPLPQPEDRTSGELTVTLVCDGRDLIVTETETRSRTPYILVGGEWVEGETVVTVTEHTTREPRAVDCTGDTPTPEAPEPTPVPATPTFTG
jgi:hypothetical protein